MIKGKKGFFKFSFVFCLYRPDQVCKITFFLVLLTPEKYIRECVYCFFLKNSVYLRLIFVTLELVKGCVVFLYYSVNLQCNYTV